MDRLKKDLWFSHGNEKVRIANSFCKCLYPLLVWTDCVMRVPWGPVAPWDQALRATELLQWEVDGQYPGGKGSWGQQDQPQPWALGTSLGMGWGQAGTQACRSAWLSGCTAGQGRAVRSWKMALLWHFWGRGWWSSGAEVGPWAVGRIWEHLGGLARVSKACGCLHVPFYNL